MSPVTITFFFLHLSLNFLILNLSGGGTYFLVSCALIKAIGMGGVFTMHGTKWTWSEFGWCHTGCAHHPQPEACEIRFTFNQNARALLICVRCGFLVYRWRLISILLVFTSGSTCLTWCLELLCTLCFAVVSSPLAHCARVRLFFYFYSFSCLILSIFTTIRICSPSLQLTELAYWQLRMISLVTLSVVFLHVS